MAIPLPLLVNAKDKGLDDSREGYANVEGRFENVVVLLPAGVSLSREVTVWPG
jgi:hypothetical protein